MDEDDPVYKSVKKSVDISELPNSHGGSFVSGLINSYRDLYELPGDVATGKLDLNSEEAIARSLGAVGTLGGTGFGKAALAKPSADIELGIFAGPKSKTADLSALSKAQELQKQGMNRDHILSETKWFQGKDGKWRYEISDDASHLNSNLAHTDYADKVLNHKDLYEAYPDLADVIIQHTEKPGHGWSRRPERFGESPNGRIALPRLPDEKDKLIADMMGWTYTGANPRDDLPVLLHEMQHQIQAREGFTGGSSPKFIPQQIMERAGHLPLEDLQRLEPIIDAFSKLHPDDHKALIHRLYERNAGEVEANQVMNRRHMTPAERLDYHPMDDLPHGISEHKIIVPFKDINEY